MVNDLFDDYGNPLLVDTTTSDGYTQIFDDGSSLTTDDSGNITDVTNSPDTGASGGGNDSTGSGAAVDVANFDVKTLPIGVRTQVGSGFVTRNANGSVTYQDDAYSEPYTKQANGNYTGGSGNNMWTYDAAKGTYSGTGIYADKNSSSWSNVFSKLTNAFKTDGKYDIAKLLPLIGGIYAASKPNETTRPSGYQGGIPTYTATRQAPGPGQRLSGNVLYTKSDGTQVNPNVLTAPTGLASIAPRAAESPVAPPADDQNVVKAARGGLLQTGGFVVPADVVSHLGNGSSSAGLQLLAKKIGATPIRGNGDGMSDSIPASIDGKEPARVANEEAYVSPDKVAQLGNGDAKKGAEKLRNMMERIRQARTGSKEQGRQINPNNYMPGGSVKRYAPGDIVSGTGSAAASGVGSAAASGVTGTESSLSNWAGPYVTDMLAKGKALSESPYEAYTGPLTAGTSDLQDKVFSGLASTQFPGILGQSFSSSSAPTIGADGAPSGSGGIASSYMNPYLSAVLAPQLDEMRRAAAINNLQGLGSFTKSGAYGGSRQALMESENARNLMQQQNKAIAEGYSNAYDKAMNQFNTEQGQAKTLVDLLAQQGQAQRGIESEQIAADKSQFEEARANPFKMLQFEQSLLSGLPLSAQTYNTAPTNDLTQFAGGVSTLIPLLKSLGILPAS